MHNRVPAQYTKKGRVRHLRGGSRPQPFAASVGVRDPVREPPDPVRLPDPALELPDPVRGFLVPAQVKKLMSSMALATFAIHECDWTKPPVPQCPGRSSGQFGPALDPFTLGYTRLTVRALMQVLLRSGEYLSFCGFSRFTVVFLGPPAGFPTLPAVF